MGLVWLYWALSDALYWAIFYFVSTPDQDWKGLGPDGQASVLTTIVELILAVSLILGAGGWKSILFKLRYGSSAGPTRKDTA